MSLRAGEQVKNEVEAHSGGFPARDSFITEPVAEWAVFPACQDILSFVFPTHHV